MKDNIQNQENERSPLLPTIQHNSSSSTAPFLLSNTPTYSDSQPLAGYSSTQLEYVKEESFSRPLKIVLLSFILVSFIIFNLHQIVIPHRIQQQINSNQGLTINSITIHPFTASNSITLTVKGERRVAIHPPTTITLSKTRLDILAISTKLNKPRIVHSIQNGLVNWFGFGLKEWTGEDAYYAKSQILGHFSIPDQVTPTDVDAVRLDFESAFKIYAKGVRRVMLDLKSVELIRMQGIANILFENIGNYRIPMWSTIQIQDNKLSSFNSSITGKRVTMEFDVITGKPYYQVELTFSVINATPLVLLQQRVGLYGLVYYENQEILSIMLPTNSLALKKGVNTNKKVQIKTNPDKMDALMEFIGRYSEGESIQVNLKGIKAVYTGDDGRKIGWIDDILDELSFNITVPAGSEEMIGSESKYSPLAI